MLSSFWLQHRPSLGCTGQLPCRDQCPTFVLEFSVCPARGRGCFLTSQLFGNTNVVFHVLGSMQDLLWGYHEKAWHTVPGDEIGKGVLERANTSLLLCAVHCRRKSGHWVNAPEHFCCSVYVDLYTKLPTPGPCFSPYSPYFSVFLHCCVVFSITQQFT